MKGSKAKGAGELWAALGLIMAEDILSASDEDILAEAVEDGIDPAAKASELRESALVKLRQAKRERLVSARAGYEAARQAANRAKSRPPVAEIIRRIQGLIKGGSSNELSLAFRKGQKMSDSDWEGLWDDLVEKGLIDDGRQDG